MIEAFGLGNAPKDIVAKYGGWKVSPSQVKTWDECNRKWGYRYIDGIDSPPGAGAILGSKTHDVLEKYFNGELEFTGEKYMQDRPMRMAQDMVELLPAPDDILFNESKFWFVWDGVLYRGIIDLAWEEDKGFVHMLPVISDHKTSSNPVKYGLTEPELLTDVQAVTYAVFGLAHFDCPTIGLQWTYVKSKGKPAPFSIRNTTADVVAHTAFEKLVHPTGLKIIQAIREVDKAEKLEANPLSCGNFGGCPHADYCPRTLEETITMALGPKKDTRMGSLKALMAGARTSSTGESAPRRRDPDARRAVRTAGDNINSPEAPANDDVAQAVSKEVGAAEGSRKEQAAKAAAAAAAAQGATTGDEARQQMDDAKPPAPVAPTGAPEGWEWNVSPSQDQILAWVYSGTFHDFASTKAAATPARPFAHGRTLGALEKSGWVFIQKLDGYRRVRMTDTGRVRVDAEMSSWDDVWVSSAPKPTDVLPVTAAEEGAAYAERVEVNAMGLAVMGHIRDGKLELTIDLAQFGGA